MSQFREGESDPTPRSPQVLRWHECRCAKIEKGEYSCEDDGLVSHGGAHHEGFDHGMYTGGERIIAAAQTAPCSAAVRTLVQLRPCRAAPARASWRGTTASCTASGQCRPVTSTPGGVVA